MDASVPFLYKQYVNARTMGKPQPLKIPSQKIPSFEPRIRSAMRIQRVVLPCKQQFIKHNLPCLYRSKGERERSLCSGFFLCYYIVRTAKEKMFAKDFSFLSEFIAFYKKVCYTIKGFRH